MSIDPVFYLALAGLMFTIGVVGALVRRNAIVIFMFIELMLNAVNLAFVTFARMTNVQWQLTQRKEISSSSRSVSSTRGDWQNGQRV